MTASTPGAYTVIRRVFDDHAEGFGTGNEAIVDGFFSPDQVEHQFGLTDTGAEAI